MSSGVSSAGKVKRMAEVPSRAPARSATRAERQSGPAFQPPFALGSQAIEQLLSSGMIQAKLRVSQPDDPDEQEADRAAAAVVAQSHSPKIQRKCSCNGSGSSCAKCQEEDETIHRSVASPMLHSSQPPVQRAPAVDNSSQAPENTGNPPKTSPTPQRKEPVVVEDDAMTVSPNQMRKSAFIASLRSDACASADAVLMSVGRTTKSCPYIEKWLAFYAVQSADHIERAIEKYVPEAASARNARELIRQVVSHAQQAATVWAKTGKITGIPAGMAMSPDQSSGKDMPSPGNSEKPSPQHQASHAESGAGPAAKFVQRRATTSTSSNLDASTIRSELRQGRSLDPSVRSRMESAFGQSFAQVRVHVDSSAANLATRIDARAFTLGHDIAFASGQYQPGSLAGDTLIAHELAHVVQQHGATGVPMAWSNSGSDNSQLEHEADHSAFHAISSLWLRGQTAMAGIVTNAYPRLRSGLRIQRCSCDRSKEVKPTAPLKDTLPAFTCAPVAASLDDIKKLPGVPTGVLGVTKASAPHPAVTIHPSSDSSCTLSVTPMPHFGLDHIFYTKPGTYKIGTETISTGKCRGKVVPQMLEVTPALSEKVKAGEIEHCEDSRRAWMLSFGRYNQVFDELSHSYCAEGSDCNSETEKRFKERAGVEYKDLGKVFKCLFDKTGIRDTKDWHTAEINARDAKVAADCSAITYKPDATKVLTEVGKHKPEELVKGCGE